MPPWFGSGTLYSLNMTKKIYSLLTNNSKIMTGLYIILGIIALFVFVGIVALIYCDDETIL